MTSAPAEAEPSSYQHEVDVEVEDLVAHVYAVGVGEVIPQVRKRPGGALEMGAGNLHALRGRENACQVCTALLHACQASRCP